MPYTYQLFVLPLLSRRIFSTMLLLLKLYVPKADPFHIQLDGHILTISIAGVFTY